MSGRTRRREEAIDLRHLSKSQSAAWPHALTSFLVRWTGGVEVQHNAIFAPSPSGDTDLAHEFYVIALANLLRGVELVRDTAQDDRVRDGVVRELEKFNEAAPSVKSIRNIVEHFDDYAIGAGDLQWTQGATGPRFTIYDVWYTRDPETNAAGLQIGSYEIDTTATEAAIVLTERVLDLLLDGIKST